ncbi:MAG: hypothetical protein WC666_03460 [Candidatus Paceibacterota bacterium]|jgi:uncharacterized membrane protein YphA (DoxX/SURF4 family)
MLSLFPSLFTYEQFGPFIIRIALGLTFLYFGYRRIKEQTQPRNARVIAYGIVETIVGILTIIGLYTQLATLIIVLILLIKLVYKIKNREFLTNGINYYLLLLAMALSLLVTGAGFIAFDMPL